MTTSSGRLEPTLRTTPQEICATCGSHGGILYARLRDQLFHAPGEWSVRRCQNPACQMIWLDPMPHADDLPTFYETYYTHSSSDDQKTALNAENRKPKSRRFWKTASRRGYLATKFGYDDANCGWLERWMGVLQWLMPVQRLKLDFSVMHLPAVPNGRVLDVGCGGGQILSRLQELGWHGEGVDFDPQAVAAAKERGVTVKLGSLIDQQYPANSFDAVIMSHVIEHVPDPLALIRECHRILKPAGRLVMVTPNPDSLTHRLFGRAWRGLETPRHLYIQSRGSFEKIVGRAGFASANFQTSARFAEHLFQQCFEIQHRQSRGTTLRKTVAQTLACKFLEAIEIGLMLLGMRTLGEEHVCIAMKSPATSLPAINECEARRAA